MAQARFKQHLDSQQPRTKQQHRVNRRGVISGQNAHAGLCGGNQLDVFGTGKHDNVLEFGDRCRCYFNGVPTYCVTDTKGFLSSVFGEDFMEQGTWRSEERKEREFLTWIVTVTLRSFRLLIQPDAVVILVHTHFVFDILTLQLPRTNMVGTLLARSIENVIFLTMLSRFDPPSTPDEECK